MASAAIPIRHQRARGGAALRFIAARGGTRLAHLHQAPPMRILFPDPEPGDPPLAALVNTAGGLAGGDEVTLAVTLDPGTLASISTPSAEKIYRSLGPETRVSAHLSLAAGAMLEWIPQETILFDGARLTRWLEADIATDSTLMMAEMLVFGRQARGERLTAGSLLDAWRIRRGGVLVWADGLALGPEPRVDLDRSFGFNGAEAHATLLLASPLPLEPVRDGLREAGAAATIIRPGVMVLRWLGGATMVRAGLAAAICALRSRMLGLPPHLPRLWTC